MKEVLLNLGKQAPYVAAIIVVVWIFLSHIERAGEWQSRTMAQIATQMERLTAELMSTNRTSVATLSQIETNSRTIERVVQAVDKLVERMAAIPRND